MRLIIQRAFSQGNVEDGNLLGVVVFVWLSNIGMTAQPGNQLIETG